MYRDDVQAPIRVRLLGTVDIEVGGQPLAVDTRKAVALLAYVAVTGLPVSRDGLAALLWPEAVGKDARGALRRTLSVLNAGLGGAGLRIDRHAVQVDADSVEVDVQRFARAVATARSHGHGADAWCASCLGVLEDAAALDRGDFMAGFALRDSEEFDAWQLAETEAHRRELAGVLERLARGHAAGRDWAAAITSARRWLALDPLHEPAHQVLIVLYARAGETGAAIRQYRDAVATLDRELGVAPLAEMTALYESIRDGTLVADAAPAPRVVEAPLRHDGAATMPFVGRDAELASLLDALAASERDGRLVIVEGAPGVGKTRLAEELAVRATAAQSTVVAAAAYPGEAGIPYGALVSLVRAGLSLPGSAERLATVPGAACSEISRLVPGLLPPSAAPPPLPEGPGDHARLLEGVCTVLAALAAGDAPGILFLDDAQWADASTHEVLAYLSRRLAGRPVLVLLAARREDLDESGRVALAALERIRDAAVIRLAGLDAAAVAVLVAATGVAVDPAVLAAESDGLPLFVVEALNNPSAPGALPGGVRALLDERLDRLGEMATQVLSAIAVLGRPADIATARGTSGRTEEETVTAMEELLRRGVVREVQGAAGDGPTCDLAHAAFRETVLDRTSLGRRRLLHRRAAETLRALAGRSPDLGRLARIAEHERAAGRDAEAAVAFREAGDLARSIYANAEAVEHLRTAVALGHADAAGIHEEIGELLTRSGAYQAAVASLERAAALADATRLPAIERRLALAQQRRGDHDAAASHLAAALETTAPSDPMRARLLAEQAVVAFGAGNPVFAADRAKAALAMVSPDDVATAHAERILGLVAATDGSPDAEAPLHRSLAAAERAADPGLVIAARNALSLVAAASGDVEAAVDHARLALGEAHRTGDLHLEAAVESNLGDTLHAAGREAESREHQLRAVALFSEVGGRPGDLQPEIWKLSAW